MHCIGRYETFEVMITEVSYFGMIADVIPIVSAFLDNRTIASVARTSHAMRSLHAGEMQVRLDNCTARQAITSSSKHALAYMYKRDGVVNIPYMYIATDIIEFLHASCGVVFNSTLMNFAAEFGFLDMAIALGSCGCPFGERAYNEAARNGHLEVLTYLCDRGVCPKSICLPAAEQRHLHVLKFLHARGYVWDENVLSAASQGGSLVVLVYLLTTNATVNNRICLTIAANAAHNGDIGMLEFLHRNKCPMDRWSIIHAAVKGHLHVVKFLHETCKIPVDVMARSTQDDSVLQYLTELQ
jgi:hypothetical protein